MLEKQYAKRALVLMDLTSLEDSDTDEKIRQLCAQANTAFGHTAAVCVYPRFIQTAQDALGSDSPIKVATVTNFPQGNADVEAAICETEAAVAQGAHEVDVVFPYRAYLNGDMLVGRELVAACAEVCHAQNVLLKVIIESGELVSERAIRSASELVIEAGGDFLKTSTGKVSVNATPEAARYMLETIRASGKHHLGFKAAGGVRTVQDAAIYLDLADEIMGSGWVSPATFRFGASGLLNNLLATLNDQNIVQNQAIY